MTETPARKRDAARTRALLLEAACRRFADVGYAATTVREIADAAGVNVALISRYFESKEGLFAACLSVTADRLRETTGHIGLAELPEAMARQVTATTDDGRMDLSLMLLLRTSGDAQAEELRRGVLRRYAEGLARTAGDGPEALLRAQLVLAVGVGVAVLRATSGLEPLVSVSAEELTGPLREMIGAAVSSGP